MTIGFVVFEELDLESATGSDAIEKLGLEAATESEVFEKLVEKTGLEGTSQPGTESEAVELNVSAAVHIV